MVGVGGREPPPLVLVLGVVSSLGRSGAASTWRQRDGLGQGRANEQGGRLTAYPADKGETEVSVSLLT